MKDEREAAAAGYMDDARDLFRQYRILAEMALEQVSDEEFFATSGDGSNSAALLVKHIAGNQRSRWTDFLTEDGEKPDRDRDSEFEARGETRGELMAGWEAGWELLFTALEGLSDGDLTRSVRIRGERLSVLQAVNRQLTHYAYHVGQIVFIAKSFRGSEWASISVPKGRSAEFNKHMLDRTKSGRMEGHYLEGARKFFDEDGVPEVEN